MKKRYDVRLEKKLWELNEDKDFYYFIQSNYSKKLPKFKKMIKLSKDSWVSIDTNSAYMIERKITKAGEGVIGDKDREIEVEKKENRNV